MAAETSAEETSAAEATGKGLASLGRFRGAELGVQAAVRGAGLCRRPDPEPTGEIKGLFDAVKGDLNPVPAPCRAHF